MIAAEFNKESGAMDWYKNHLKIYSIVATTLLVLTAGSLYYGHSNYQKVGPNNLIKDGVGTCFQRVTQTFTALMIAQTTSNYLSGSFINNTGECFNEVNRLFSEHLAGFKGAHQTVNKLISDSHWFHEKVSKINAMNKSARELSESNITEKYRQLEQSRDQLVEFLRARAEAALKVAQTGNWAALGFFSLLMVLSIGQLVIRARRATEMAEVEKKSMELSADNQVFEIEGVISKALKLAEMPHTRQLFLESRTQLVATPVVTAVVAETEEETETVGTTNTTTEIATSVSQTFSVALKGLRSKAFTHGVIVDFDLDDHLQVKTPQEDFGQLLHNILDYTIEASIQHNQGRKVTVRSKALGNAAYIKFAVAGHCFNSTELDYFSGGHERENIGVNLTLIHELVQDLGGEVTVKNRMTAEGTMAAAEMEITFERVMRPVTDIVTEEWSDEEIAADTKASNKQITIVKGKKKDLMRQMSSEV